MTDHKQQFEALKARYPYMFVECIGHMQKGWLSVFEELCHQVDPLGGEEAQLHWVQLEEKRGHASWIVKFRNKTRANTLRLLQMSDLILAAEASTAKICIVCGEPGEVDVGLVPNLALCQHHHEQHARGEPLHFKIL